MPRSFFTRTKDSDVAAGSAIFSAAITLAPTTYGLTAPLASSYAGKHAVFAAALAAIGNPATKTTALVIAKNEARKDLVQMASELSKLVDGTSTVTDEQRAELGLSVRSRSAPAPAPGTCSNFKAGLLGDGSLELKWRANNPAGLGGVTYQVWRRLGSEGEFTYQMAMGVKKYVDSTIPVGTVQAQYQIRGIRPTAAGAWAQFDVNFFKSTAGVVSTQVTQTTPVKLAA